VGKEQVGETEDLRRITGTHSDDTAGPTYITPVAWNRTDGELRANDVAVIALADGRRVLASGGDDSAAHVWNTRDGDIVRSVLGHSVWVLSVALTQLPSGAVLLATGGKDGIARIWGAKTGTAGWRRTSISVVTSRYTRHSPSSAITSATGRALGWPT
jgi:WD40 repeat protein